MIPVHEVEAILIIGGLLAAACCAVAYAIGRGDRRRLPALRAAWRAELRGDIEATVRAAYSADVIKARSDRTKAEVRAADLERQLAEVNEVNDLLTDEVARLGRRVAEVRRLADSFEQCTHLLQGPGVAARIRRAMQERERRAVR